MGAEYLQLRYLLGRPISYTARSSRFPKLRVLATLQGMNWNACKQLPVFKSRPHLSPSQPTRVDKFVIAKVSLEDILDPSEGGLGINDAMQVTIIEIQNRHPVDIADRCGLALVYSIEMPQVSWKMKDWKKGFIFWTSSAQQVCVTCVRLCWLSLGPRRLSFRIPRQLGNVERDSSSGLPKVATTENTFRLSTR